MQRSEYRPGPGMVGAPEPEAATKLVIWGTDISISEVEYQFSRFINEFVLPDPAEDELLTRVDPEEQQPYYLARLEEVNKLLLLS